MKCAQGCIWLLQRPVFTVGCTHSLAGCPLLNFEGPCCIVCVSGTLGQFPTLPQQRNHSNTNCGTLIIFIIKELQVVTKRCAPSCNTAGINKPIMPKTVQKYKRRVYKILKWPVVDYNIYVYIFLSGFGGLEVACWPLVPAGFKPGRSRRIFKGK